MTADERDYDLMRCGACGTEFKRKHTAKGGKCPRCNRRRVVEVTGETPRERELRVSRSRMHETSRALMDAREAYTKACKRYHDAHVEAFGRAPSNDVLRAEPITIEEDFGS